uniref:Synaptotagmin-like protein 1 n=1 Tax=Amphilophus citrinellus TaxID=61819 RepID=A0A3Q0T153_AMPCI
MKTVGQVLFICLMCKHNLFLEMEGKQGDSSLDLSHLTEEEQTSILQVVQRDLELRRRDEGRVRSETNPTHLRFLSGAWFSEERSKRHHNWMSGCDLVHSTIRHRKTKSRGKEKLSKTCATYSIEGLPQSRISFRNNCYIFFNFNKHNKSARLQCCAKFLNCPSFLYIQYCFQGLSGSMMSLFSSGDFGVVEVRGRIQYSLAYDNQKEELQVKVYRCEDIAAARKNRSDPYVKTYLLPDKSNHSKKKTSVKKKTLNPVYDQTLRYKVRIGELRSRTLNLSVWHAEPLGRNVFLGEVEVALALWDWTCTQPLWQDLQPRVYLSPDSISSRGNIMFSIKFIPEGYEGGGLPLTGEVHIWLREAQVTLHLHALHPTSYILPDASRQSSQKTRVVKRSISPTYNHTMVYDGFHTSDLREACAELTVWQREGLKTHVLGGIRLSCGTGQSYGEAVSWMDSTEEEVAAWMSMIENPNHWIDATLPIRTNLARRSE